MRFNKSLIAAFLGFQPGGWMIFDGFHVLTTGKYYGPPEPGPWASLVSALGFHPFSLGPAFLILGFAWVMAATLLLLKPAVGRILSLCLAVVTLFYLPVGTLYAVCVIALLFRPETPAQD